MADFLFVPQTVLDRWSEQGKVAIEGYVLTLLGENKVFNLTAAVRFLKMEAGDDHAGLLQKVKTVDALKQMGAEHFESTVILGENAYQVQQGFLADASAIRRAAAAAAAQASASSQGILAATPSSGGVSAPKPAPASGATGEAQKKTAEIGKPAETAKPAEPGKAAPDAGEKELLAQFFLENLQ